MFRTATIAIAKSLACFLSRSIDSAMLRFEFELTAFVFMPEHVHLLILPKKPDTAIGAILSVIKRPLSFRIKRELAKDKDPLLDKLTIRERPGKTSFRFWQEGGGYDRNIFQWDVLKQVAQYIHLNPVRRGLCGDPMDWKWSSYRSYECPGHPLDPDLPRIDGIPR